jgi:hypothetical protein
MITDQGVHLVLHEFFGSQKSIGMTVNNHLGEVKGVMSLGFEGAFTCGL